jgi:hypothetical protein
LPVNHSVFYLRPIQFPEPGWNFISVKRDASDHPALIRPGSEFQLSGKNFRLSPQPSPQKGEGVVTDEVNSELRIKKFRPTFQQDRNKRAMQRLRGLKDTWINVVVNNGGNNLNSKEINGHDGIRTMSGKVSDKVVPDYFRISSWMIIMATIMPTKTSTTLSWT